MAEGERADMDWTARRVLASDVAPMVIRPSWTAVGAAYQVNQAIAMVRTLSQGGGQWG